METREQENFEEDLKEFQSARRKLLYDVLTLQVTRVSFTFSFDAAIICMYNFNLAQEKLATPQTLTD